MHPRKWKPIWVSTGLLGAIFLAAVVLFLLGGRWTRYVLFFPGADGVQVNGEARLLPRRGSLEGNLELLVDEVILGPANPLLRRYLPRDIRVQSVVAGQGGAYVSLSHELLWANPEYHGTPAEALQTLANTILYNFHGIHRLYLLVDGQLLDGQGQDGFVYDEKILR